MGDLKPCPHCGEEPVEQAIEAHKHYLVNLPDYPGSHVIECVCGAGSIGETRDEAKAKWNRRAQPAITSENGNQAAQGASAITSGPLLTVEQIQTAWVEHGLDDCAVEDFARAIESLVRSKLGAGVGWISCEDQMPKPGRVVLACYTNELGNVRRIRAQWVAAKTSESSGEAECGEYDEATDTYYDPEGWYECIDNWDEYSSVFVRPKITHWMPLPPPPGNVGKEGA